MKKISSTFLLFLAISVCMAQNYSSITSVKLKPKAGITNQYIYQPAKNLSIPDKIQAVVIYQNKQEFLCKTIQIDKTDNKYRFSFKAPDSTSVLIFSITTPNQIIHEKNSLYAEKKIIFDNNNEKGFIINLLTNAGSRFTHEKLDLAALLDNNIIYSIDLKETPNPSLIKLYEDSYKLYPAFKNETTYLDYLFLLYSENENLTRPKLLSYASKLLKVNDEEKWTNAFRIYGRLKMAEERKAVGEKILIAFPTGKKANENFWSEFYANSDTTTEEKILATMNAYMSKFNDNTVNTKDRFYALQMERSIAHKDWLVAFKYGNLINKKIRPAYQYDYIAWKLSGKQTNNPGIDLENAKILSARSIAISTILMNDKTERDEDALKDLREAHYKFYDTYALILYKLGQYDSAFYYQNLVGTQGKEFNTGGMERFAAYAEKIKGALFTKDYIENKLLAGNKSPIMLKQLQGIYKQFNMPEDEYNRLQEKSLLLAKQKNDAEIIAIYGSLKAPDFSLKNMMGEIVTLSQLKNKVVILDFWATWCSPCKASFPTMQLLVNKYKDDKDIAFLFIDTKEFNTPQNTLAEVSKYIQEKKYSFNVLFDSKNRVKKDYKVESIPRKFIIDKAGNILYASENTGVIPSNEEIIKEMSAIIDAAKKVL